MVDPFSSSPSMLSPLSRSMGILYGQFIGDALGSRYEFKRGTDVKTKLESDRDGSDVVPLLGGGPFGYGPGVVTDDGEMAMSMLSSCLHLNRFDPSSVACSYVRWAQMNPPDIGNTCRSALTLLVRSPTELKKVPSDWTTKFSREQKDAVRKEVEENVRKYNANSLSNGSLMRQSVLTAFYASNGNTEELLKAVEADTLLTHSNPVAIEASKLFAFTLINIVKGMTPEDAVKVSLSSVSSPLLHSLVEAARKVPTPIVMSNGQRSNGDDTHIGYLGVSLQIALHSLLHASSFSSGLLDVVSIGGDTDTNGCIAAALLGARFGEDGIPAKWKYSVETASLRLKGENGIHSFDQFTEGIRKRFE